MKTKSQKGKNLTEYINNKEFLRLFKIPSLLFTIITADMLEFKTIYSAERNENMELI